MSYFFDFWWGHCKNLAYSFRRERSKGYKKDRQDFDRMFAFDFCMWLLDCITKKVNYNFQDNKSKYAKLFRKIHSSSIDIYSIL